MAKTVEYKLTSDGPFVGASCGYSLSQIHQDRPSYGKSCTQMVRFTVVPYGKPGQEGTGVCGQHLTPEIDRVLHELNVPAIVQEVPVRHRKQKGKT